MFYIAAALDGDDPACKLLLLPPISYSSMPAATFQQRPRSAYNQEAFKLKICSR